jgi:hypothetical protein
MHISARIVQDESEMYPPEVINALKEALRNAYWYKRDLRQFMLAAAVPAEIVNNKGWDDDTRYKVSIVAQILEELLAMGDEGIGPMRRLIRGVLEIPNFDHLARLEDGASKVTAARSSVEAPRTIVRRNSASEPPPSVRGRTNSAGEAAKKLNEVLGVLQRRFAELTAMTEPQRRGIEFEVFLRDLFLAHDLDPRGSFRIVGEQIDGAFEFEGTQFLLEAKWESSRIGVAPLDAFVGKIDRKLDNTLGLFVALNGFTDEGLAAFVRGRLKLILCSGEDIALVVQGLVDLRDMLKRKIRHAAQTGNPYLTGRDILGSTN